MISLISFITNTSSWLPGISPDKCHSNNHCLATAVSIICTFFCAVVINNQWRKKCQDFFKKKRNLLPPAAKGTLFEKTVPLDPLQKLLISKFVGDLLKFS
jgi:hypothetical protein